jgi:hypothetical protein
MSHYAEIDSNNVVVRIIVAEQDFIDSGAVGNPSSWVQTSYNTKGGIHLLGGTPLRKNFAGIGYTYDPAIDAFVPPKPYESWLLNEETCLWEAPVQRPDDDKFYNWDESSLSWVEVIIEE